MKKTDICYYMSLTKEENSSFAAGDQVIDKQQNGGHKKSFNGHYNRDGDGDGAKCKLIDISNNPKDDGSGLPKIMLQVPYGVSECCLAKHAFSCSLCYKTGIGKVLLSRCYSVLLSRLLYNRGKVW